LGDQSNYKLNSEFKIPVLKIEKQDSINWISFHLSSDAHFKKKNAILVGEIFKHL
jgi:hypothetical protein